MRGRKTFKPGSKNSILKIVIESYNSQWPLLFEREKAVIYAATAHLHPSIEHIGSTSVPGLGAKPIIDILLGVENDEALNNTILPMTGSGYTYFKKYESGMPYRRFFVRLHSLNGSPVPEKVAVEDEIAWGIDFNSTVHVHALVKDTEHWTRHIAFRDYMRTHPLAREEYETLKRKLVQNDFKDGLAYNAAKDHFMKQTEQLALAWQKSAV